jgi:molecular chaperone DnaK
MRVVLGLDLGTSNLVAAYRKNDALLAYDWGDMGDGFLLPAYVQLGSDGVVVGDLARTSWQQGEPNCYRRFKMRIGRVTGETGMSASRLLKELVLAARAAMLGGERYMSEITEIDSAVITVPHAWNEAQRLETRRAVEAAGVPVRRVLSEPVAAAAYYAYLRRRRDSANVLVCDMGGGTFDISLAEIRPYRGVRVVERLTATNESAGMTADALIVAHILSSSLGIAVDPEALLGEQDSPEIRYALSVAEKKRATMNHEACRLLKKPGCSTAQVEPERCRFAFDGVSVDYDLGYDEMADVIAPVCTRAYDLVTSALDAAGPNRPTEVVLAGGMTRMLAVQQAIARAMGVPVKSLLELGQESDRAIARGAAVVGDGTITVEEVLPYSIGVVAADYQNEAVQVNSILLRRGSRVPSAIAHHTVCTTKESRDHIELLVALGESTDPSACNLIRRELPVRGTVSRGTVHEISLRVDESMLLCIEITRGSGDTQTVRVDLPVAAPGAHASSGGRNENR